MEALQLQIANTAIEDTVRSLSCFSCQHSNLGLLNVENYEARLDVIVDMNIENLSLQIHSPTVFNNIDDNMLLSKFYGSMFLDDTIASTPEPAKTIEKKCKVKILSNVPFDYQHYSFYKNSTQESNTFDQCEFEKFIRSPRVEDPDFEESKQRSPKTVEFPHMEIDEETIKEDKEVPFKYDLNDWIKVQ